MNQILGYTGFNVFIMTFIEFVLGHLGFKGFVLGPLSCCLFWLSDVFLYERGGVLVTLWGDLWEGSSRSWNDLLGSCGEVLGGLVAPLPPADVMNQILGY